MGLIVCPSRELARQTQEVIVGYLEALRGDGAPELRSLLVMGGIDMRQQARPRTKQGSGWNVWGFLSAEVLKADEGPALPPAYSWLSVCASRRTSQGS